MEEFQVKIGWPRQSLAVATKLAIEEVQ